MADPRFDLIVKNVRLVRPGADGTEALDLGIVDGRFARIAPDIRLSRIVRGVIPFLVLLAIAIVLLCFFPWIATALPDHTHGQ